MCEYPLCPVNSPSDSITCDTVGLYSRSVDDLILLTNGVVSRFQGKDTIVRPRADCAATGLGTQREGDLVVSDHGSRPRRAAPGTSLGVVRVASGWAFLAAAG
jgi:hypothetical protein